MGDGGRNIWSGWERERVGSGGMAESGDRRNASQCCGYQLARFIALSPEELVVESVIRQRPASEDGIDPHQGLLFSFGGKREKYDFAIPDVNHHRRTCFQSQFNRRNISRKKPTLFPFRASGICNTSLKYE